MRGELQCCRHSMTTLHETFLPVFCLKWLYNQTVFSISSKNHLLLSKLIHTNTLLRGCSGGHEDLCP